MTTPRRRGDADPVRAGVALGGLLWLTFMVAGRGLGASGAFAAGSAAVVGAVAPERVGANRYLADWAPRARGGLFGEWIVIELLAVGFGAWGSARLAGRRRPVVERVATESSRSRLLAAAGGGALMGAGARLAHGCTSGLGLTGGALLSTGAWVFIPVAFATAFLTTRLREGPAAGVVR
ncbi:MAG: YeeE/YedE thiosulfate transporter family protein [Gemmatimonadales bacterium]